MNADKIKTDQALAAFHRYKGKCSNCSKFGHKTADCRSKTASQKKEESGDSKKNKKEKKTKRDLSMIQCFQCGEMGHFQSRCLKNKSKKGSEKLATKDVDMVLMVVEEGIQACDNVWIANFGASKHITNSEAGLYNIKTIHEPVKISDGKLVYVTKVGKL